MADKLSWTDLRHALALRAGVNEKKAGAFLSAFQDQLIEVLKTDKQVKINGLGTFKVQAVAPRKSVNVNTGEEIIIEGYNKLVFAPEAGVKELVEKQPKEIDPLKKLGAQAEEIVDILGDLGQSPKEEVKEPEPEPVVIPEPVKEPESEPVVIPESVVEPEPEPVVIPEPVKEPEPEPVIIPEPVKEPEPEPVVIPEPVVEPKPKKKYHFVRDTLICVVILLMLLLAGYFFLRHRLGDILQNIMQPSDTEVVADTTAQAVVETEEAVEVTEPAPENMIPEGEISQEQILAEFLEASGELSPAENKYPDLITTEPMHEASRLAWMAKRFYGAKIYWPYLYDANRDVISNPHNIEVGTPIRVPKLTKLQLDTTNAETMATIESLREEALRSGE